MSGLAQAVALAPGSVNIEPGGASQLQLAAQFAHEDINDPWLRLVETTIEMVEEGCLAQNGSLAQCHKR